MTDDEPLELTDEAPDFAKFEADAGKEPEPANDAEPKEPEAKEPEAKDDDPDGDDKHEKRRSKPATERIAEITRARREAERRAEAAEARLAAIESGNAVDPTQAIAELEAKRPSPEDFEFGEADSAYIDALTDWKLDVRDAKREAKEAERAKEAGATAEQQQIAGKLSEGVANVEKAGAEKYEDFETAIEAAVEARGGEPLPPLVSIGIAVSPAGADIAYRLATDDATAAKLEKLAGTNVLAAALAFGELEGEYMSDDDGDLDLRDSVDQMRLNGRMKARMRGVSKPQARKATEAPEPAKHRLRGGGGQFEAGADTTDFAAFERKANAR